MNFVSVDVETANNDMASICQIGIAIFEDGCLVDEWVSLVNPESYFDGINIRIHGIRESDVKDAPTFLQVANIVNRYFENSVVISHGTFDRVSLSKAFLKCSLDFNFGSWLDTTRVARRAWPQFAKKGYGLANVSEAIGFEFKHHDALEDAKAAGAVLIEAIKITNIALDDWPKRVNQPLGGVIKNPSGSVINPEGALFGETAVFTGSLCMTRGEAKEVAENLGCEVGKGVSKSTTLLIVGDQDIERLAGKSKSSKHLKAEELIKKGIAIRILTESDFVAMIN